MGRNKSSHWHGVSAHRSDNSQITMEQPSTYYPKIVKRWKQLPRLRFHQLSKAGECDLKNCQVILREKFPMYLKLISTWLYLNFKMFLILLRISYMYTKYFYIYPPFLSSTFTSSHLLVFFLLFLYINQV